MDVFQAIGTSPLTPITLSLSCIALVITSFARGWIVSAFQVKQLLAVQNLRIEEAIARIAEATKRGDEWMGIAQGKDKIIADQAKQIEILQLTAENTNRVLQALPQPRGVGS